MFLYREDSPVFFFRGKKGKSMNCKKLFVTSLAAESGKDLKTENEIVFH